MMYRHDFVEVTRLLSQRVHRCDVMRGVVCHPHVHVLATAASAWAGTGASPPGRSGRSSCAVLWKAARRPPSRPGRGLHRAQRGARDASIGSQGVAECLVDQGSLDSVFAAQEKGPCNGTRSLVWAQLSRAISLHIM